MSRRRIRSLKPEFFGDEKVIALGRDARYTAVGLISLADDRGRLRDRPLEILGALYPEEKVSVSQLRKWLAEIVKQQLAVRYEVEGHSYLWMPRFMRHQVVDKPTESELPAHPDDELAETPILEAYRQAKGRERSQNKPGSVAESSSRTRRVVDEDSRLTRASSPVLRSIPGVETTEEEAEVDASAPVSALAQSVADACDVLLAVKRWQVDQVAVENVAAMYPAVDLVQAARLAVTWGAGEDWEMPAAATLRSAARKLDEERQPKAEQLARRKRSADALRNLMANTEGGMA